MGARAGSLPTASETYKKGTLKVDLQALTVGVAVLAMTAWLSRVASSLRSEAPSSLDSARKLAVVNGLGEHSRAQVILMRPASLTLPQPSQFVNLGYERIDIYDRVRPINRKAFPTT